MAPVGQATKPNAGAEEPLPTGGAEARDGFSVATRSPCKLVGLRTARSVEAASTAVVIPETLLAQAEALDIQLPETTRAWVVKLGAAARPFSFAECGGPQGAFDRAASSAKQRDDAEHLVAD